MLLGFPGLLFGDVKECDGSVIKKESSEDNHLTGAPFFGSGSKPGFQGRSDVLFALGELESSRLLREVVVNQQKS